MFAYASLFEELSSLFNGLSYVQPIAYVQMTLTFPLNTNISLKKNITVALHLDSRQAELYEELPLKIK